MRRQQSSIALGMLQAQANPGRTSTRNHDIGTMNAAGTDSSPQISLKEKLHSKEPLYSRPYIPSPTSSCAAMMPHWRTKYTVVCVWYGRQQC